MAIQICGARNSAVAEVDGTTYRALRTTARPINYSVYGAYQLSMTSGTIAAALAAGTNTAGHVFCFKWGDMGGRVAIVTYLKLRFQCLTLFTANTVTDFGFDAFLARAYATRHTGGTAATLTGNSFKTRTSMGTSLVDDIRISSTAALTQGTGPTFDTDPFATSIGDSQRINPATGTEEQSVNDPTLLWQAAPSCGEMPIVLSLQEGIIIRNRAVWPAAGTGVVQVDMRWLEAEATAY